MAKSRVVRLRRSRPTRDGSLEQLLREIDALRLSFDVDLTLAAAAVEADRSDVAMDVIDADRAELARFSRWSARHLRTARDPRADKPIATAIVRTPAHLASGHRFRLTGPVLPAVAASAALVAALVAGIAPASPTSTSGPQPQVVTAMSPLAASYVEFAKAASSDADSATLIAAAQKLHRTLERLLQGAATDPALARQALRILQAERDMLRDGRPEGSATVLAQAKELVRRLQAVLPTKTLADGTAKARDGAKDDPELLKLLLPSDEPTHEPAESDDSTSAPTPSTPPAPEHDATNEPSPAPEPSDEPTSDDPSDDWWPFGSTDGFANSE